MYTEHSHGSGNTLEYKCEWKCVTQLRIREYVTVNLYNQELCIITEILRNYV